MTLLLFTIAFFLAVAVLAWLLAVLYVIALSWRVVLALLTDRPRKESL